MRSTGAVPGKFYGLPKTHKKDNPLRPIISNCDTSNYNVAKFLTNLLSSYSINDRSFVKDSFEFAGYIRQRKISNTEEMVSFEVESLFTNVRNNETIDIILKDLYNDNKSKTIVKITQNNMQKLLKIFTQESHFICNNELYEQLDGVAMGSPLGHGFIHKICE